MDTEQSLANNLENTIHLLAYERPEVITFGSIEKLTQGQNGSKPDNGQSNNTRKGGPV